MAAKQDDNDTANLREKSRQKQQKLADCCGGSSKGDKNGADAQDKGGGMGGAARLSTTGLP